MLDMLHLGGSTLLYTLLILPILTALSLALLYGIHEVIQMFRRWRGIF